MDFDQQILDRVGSRTVVITGGAGGIGAAAAKVFNEHGANVVLADIPAVKDQAQNVVASLPHPHKAAYIPVDILNWKQMNDLFQRTVEAFGDIHIVVANAAIMESTETLSMENMDNEGNLRESEEAFRVIDVNLKGTLNSISPALSFPLDLANGANLLPPSFETGHALCKVFIQKRYKTTACYYSSGIDVRIFRRYRGRGICCFETWGNRLTTSVADSSTEIRHCDQSNRTVLYSNSNHDRVNGEMESCRP
jgi:NAD(P)-dependent dehydrogenase (short-subunit alcohol dehydrogenase family)